MEICGCLSDLISGYQRLDYIPEDEPLSPKSLVGHEIKVVRDRGKTILLGRITNIDIVEDKWYANVKEDIELK